MKKQILIGLITISSMFSIRAQNWSGLTPGNIYYNQGNIGIGTTSPTKLLTLKADEYLGWEYTPGAGSFHTITGGGVNPMIFTVNPFSSNTPVFKFNGNAKTIITMLNQGNIGIGVEIPTELLTLKADEHLGWEYTPGAGSFHTITAGGINPMSFTVNSFSANTPVFNFNGKTTTIMTMLNQGNVGIGTITPEFKLDVCGTIRAREVKVDLDGTCVPDFVFRIDYKLMDLYKLEHFIKLNQHLPEIASEKEMIENGINMKELQMQLLQKIEELTLYTIEQQKKIDELVEQNHMIEKLRKLIQIQNEKIEKLDYSINQ